MDIPDRVVAWFASGVINDHVLRDTNGDNPGWAIGDCGPCAALHWLYTHRPDETSAAVANQLGGDWDWQTDGKIDWARLSEKIVLDANASD